ncbi:MAG: glycosyltransferase family 2 protein [Acidobacteria bacterium]|nr:glycosyltransferase family 2 protein [Acidobacteriota bacterium]MBP8273614.1 glycosyltransferase family 2 protein [Acidobacteriota bacterium]
MTPRTTVVVITHNYGRFLRSAVDSAMQQTRHARVMIMDDASTDDTEAVVAEIVARDPDLQCHRAATARGPSATRNAAAAIVNTEWVVFLDADDWLEPTFVERAEDWTDRHPDADVVTTDMTVYRNSQNPFVVATGTPRSWLDLTQRNVVLQTSLIRRSVVLAIAGYDSTLEPFEDWDFWIRALKSGYTITRLPGAHVHRREHGANLSKNCDEALATRRVLDRHPRPSRWMMLRRFWSSGGT